MFFKTDTAEYFEIVLPLYDSFLVYTVFGSAGNRFLEIAGTVINFGVDRGSAAECGRDGTDGVGIYTAFFSLHRTYTGNSRIGAI